MSAATEDVDAAHGSLPIIRNLCNRGRMSETQAARIFAFWEQDFEKVKRERNQLLRKNANLTKMNKGLMDSLVSVHESLRYAPICDDRAEQGNCKMIAGVERSARENLTKFKGSITL